MTRAKIVDGMLLAPFKLLDKAVETDWRKIFRNARKNKLVKHAVLFVGMFAITTTIVGLETGHLTTALTVAAIASPAKYLWAAVHAVIFGAH